MKFYRIETRIGNEYFAALSEAHVRKMLGNPDDKKSYISFAFGKLETLVEVEQKEAEHTTDYNFFLAAIKENNALNIDGTYALGFAGTPEERVNPHHFYLAQMPWARN